MIAEKWDMLARGHGALRAREPPPRDPRHRRGALRRRDRAARRRAHSDEGPRRDTSLEKMAKLQPLAPGGRLTAAVSSQISDGASALLVASERAVKSHGLTPRARIHHLSVRADDPICMLTAPIPATALRAREGGHEARRHRPRRDQRGVRLGRAGLAEGARRRPGARQRERRRDRARPPDRRHRRAADDDAALTSSSAPAAATACRRCARAAARRTSRSSSGSRWRGSARGAS